MTEPLRELISKRLKWWYCARQLSQVTTMEQFNRFMRQFVDYDFKRYADLDSLGRMEIEAVLRELNLNVESRSFLDIGPAYGSVMDLVRERGARPVEFAEYNPVFYNFNRLKGLKGYHVDVRTSLDVLPAGRYDIIWIKATYVADGFILRESWRERLRYRYPTLQVLLAQIERLASTGGTVIFCPHWRSTDGQRNITDFMSTSLTRECIERGYRVMRPIEGHNQSISPVTYYKTVTQ